MIRLALALLLLAHAAVANAPPNGNPLAQICMAAADAAADRAGVPRAVMRALTLTETGRNREGRFEPWPWTVNMEGAGHWFDTRDAALAYVEAEQARGATSFDVGCFQVNHRWHGQHFASVQSMFDPMINATYAAQFVRSLYEETGNWSQAAGFYHSRTPEFFNRYRERFDRLHARIAVQIGETVHTGAPALPPKSVAPRIVEVETPPDQPGSVATAAHNPGGVAIRVMEGRVSPMETRGRALILTAARGPLATRARRPLIGD